MGNTYCKHRSKEGYARSLEGKGVEWNGDNVEHMWEQGKQAMLDSEEKYVAQ